MAEIPESWIDEHFVTLVDDHDRPVQLVARSGDIAAQVLAEHADHETLRAAAAASLERRYDGGVLLALCGFGTGTILLTGGEAVLVGSGLLLLASTAVYLYASRPPTWKLVQRRLPTRGRRLAASALGGLSQLVLGGFGAVGGGGIILLAAVCACLPFIGLAMPVVALVQVVRNR